MLCVWQRLGEDALEKASMDYTCEIESLKANSAKLHSSLANERAAHDELEVEVRHTSQQCHVSVRHLPQVSQ